MAKVIKATKVKESFDMNAVFGSVDKLNEDAELLEDSTLSTPSEWIDTGCFALNVIMSGSLFGGIPAGRIIGFAGPSKCGKTLIINKCIANAQKNGYFGAIWDSEIAVDKKSALAVGMDPKRVKYYPVDTIEQCRNQISRLLDNINAMPKAERPKIIISIDSLGNLASSKELLDADKDKEAADVGQRAKAIKSMLRVLTYKAAKAGVPIIFSNHIYEGMSMFPTLVKDQAGGKGPIYMASILVQMGLRDEKSKDNPEEESLAISHHVSGTTLTAFTTKNRFVPSYLKTELYINFTSGLDKYSGLLDIAIGFDVIQQSGSTYSFQGEKIGYRKNFEKDGNFWEKKVFPVLEATLQEKLKYGTGCSSVDLAEEVDKIDEQDDEQETAD